MSDLQTLMNHTVASFVAQITELARRAAIDTLEAALNDTARNGKGARRMAATVSAGRGPGPGRGRPRGAMRSPDELDQLAERFQAFVKETPGLRIEQINKQLGTTTKDLALPIR